MAQFSLFIPLLQAVEGGFQKLPGDTGNYNSRGELVGTNHGISAKIYEQWTGYSPSEAVMKKITVQEAQTIYKKWYWDAVQGDSIQNQDVANLIADHAVNAGTGSAGKLVQNVLNTRFGAKLPVDGKIGSLTVYTINSVNPEALHEIIKLERVAFYKKIGGEFLQGWLNRLKKFVFEKKK